MGIIDHKFEIFGQRGDANGDFTDIIDEARSMAQQMCEGLHSASPMYAEMIETALRSFTEVVNYRLEAYKAEQEKEFAEDDALADEQAIIAYLDTQDSTPGYLFFANDEDIDEFDALWLSGKKKEALKMIEDDLELGLVTLEDYQSFVEQQ